MTPELTVRHEQPQVDRGGGWGGRQSQRGESGGRARRRGKGWVGKGGRDLGYYSTQRYSGPLVKNCLILKKIENDKELKMTRIQ